MNWRRVLPYPRLPPAPSPHVYSSPSCVMAAVHPSAYAQLKSVRSVLCVCTYHVNTLMCAHVGSHVRRRVDVSQIGPLLPPMTTCATSKRVQKKADRIQAASCRHKHCQSLVSASLAAAQKHQAAFEQAFMVETSKVVPSVCLGRQ